ncbi:MAG: CYTH domain-containing protein [Desulfomonilaceae bacterium]|nr:CYTH domain-containing protein [Desulfomonilaceae bacterium]
MTEPSDIPVEAETTLLICSHNPRSVVREIDGLQDIANFRVIGVGLRVLEDRYLDVRASELGRRGWVLRLRRVDSTWWITLKGPCRETPDGAMERSELELAWSWESLERVMNMLHIPLRNFDDRDISGADPAEIMTGLGMVVIQDRVTERRVKNVLSGDPSVVAAEIAVDRVRYDLPGRAILHYEVEIESKLQEHGSAVASIADALRKKFGSMLREWKFGKLATGMAIDALIRNNALSGLINEDGSLQPDAYDRVERYFRAVPVRRP